MEDFLFSDLLCFYTKSYYLYMMDNKEYQSTYRKTKEKNGWKYFSILVPEDCYYHLKKSYLLWKAENLQEWKKIKNK